MATISKRYSKEPTARKFHSSKAWVRGIRGPIGSGKSVACTLEVFIRAVGQAPDKQGVRRTRWAIVRNTYPELKSTTIKTWQDWIPDEVCKIVYDSPIRGDLLLELGDGTSVHAEIFFIALDKPSDIKKLLSLELTGAWVNEARELGQGIIDGITSRVGRYPSKEAAPLTWDGVIMDTNPPDDLHWWAKFENAPPIVQNEDGSTQSWEFFVQPSALIRGVDGKYRKNPEAENVSHQQKGFNYWFNQLGGKDPEWINVYILNQFGIVIDGEAVYGNQYSVTIHRSRVGLWPLKKRDIYLGWDFGLTPAVIIGQITTSGQVRILEEVCATRLGVRSFAEDVVAPLLRKKYAGCRFVSIGDPAGVSKSPTDERSCFEILDEVLGPLGISTEPAWSNDLTGRIEAVRYFLTRKTLDEEPMLLLDPQCSMLLRGFAGGYHYKTVFAGADKRLRSTPDKNQYSHPHDALQYLLLEILNRLQQSKAA